MSVVDLNSYRDRAERFLAALDREYYLHLSGRKEALEIEAIYDEFAALFSRESVEAIRDRRESGSAEEGRRLDYLLQFAIDGHLGRETRAEEAEVARLEATLEVDVGGESHPYRGVTEALANEPDAVARAELEAARNAVLEDRLNPIHRASLERARSAVAAVGWPTQLAAYEDLRGIDLRALAAEAEAFVVASDAIYESVLAPALAEAELPQLAELRRCDLPRFFRAAALDGPFAAGSLVPALERTLAGLGIDLGGQSNIHVDAERRPTKSPRAFCATPEVPEEIYLVIAPTGGRDDYAALFHEAGHAEHYANTDPGLPFEYRHLGDNTVTESFAFLFEHLTSDPLWLADQLEVRDPGPIVAHARAVKLLMLRRYAAKIAYEVELHAGADIDAARARYGALLGAATRVEWPDETWLADLDPGFYVACYLRAWSLETSWRALLEQRFGGRWFASLGAGETLDALWRSGQRMSGDELLAEASGEELTLEPLSEDVRRWTDADESSG